MANWFYDGIMAWAVSCASNFLGPIALLLAVYNYGYYSGSEVSVQERLNERLSGLEHYASRTLHFMEGWEREKEQSREIHFALVRYWNREQDANSTLPYAHQIPMKVDSVSRDLQDLIKKEYEGLYPNRKFNFSLKFRGREISADRTLHQLGALYFSKPAKILPGAFQVFLTEMQEEEKSILCEVEEERNFGAWRSPVQISDDGVWWK